jgi:hypothetical protein
VHSQGDNGSLLSATQEAALGSAVTITPTALWRLAAGFVACFCFAAFQKEKNITSKDEKNITSKD